MKKFVKSLFLILASIICMNCSFVFAADLTDPYNMYSGSYKTTGTIGNDLYERSSTTYMTINSSSSMISVNPKDTTYINAASYKYIVAEFSVLPVENVDCIYLARQGNGNVSQKLTDWTVGKINNFRFVCEYLSTNVEKAQANYNVKAYINGKYINQMDSYFSDNNNKLEVRIKIDATGNLMPKAYVGAINLYATNTTPKYIAPEKAVADSYAINGNDIFVNSTITTAKGLCDAVIADRAAGTTAKVYKADDYNTTYADTDTLANDAIFVVKDGSTGVKTLYTVNLNKTALFMHGGAVDIEQTKTSLCDLRYDNTKELKATAYVKENANIIVARYDNSGNLIDCSFTPVSANTFNTLTLSEIENNANRIKAFLWNDFEKMSPLVEEIKLLPQVAEE